MLVVPAVLPFILLKDCVVLPTGHLPLYIFEDRYKKMMDAVLEGSRLMAVGNLNDWADERAVDEYSVACVVESCVKNKDGTYQVLIRGLKRIKIELWSSEEVYPTARVREVQTCFEQYLLWNEQRKKSSLVELLNRINQLLGKSPFELNMEEFNTKDLDKNQQLVDMLAYFLIRDLKSQMEFLQINCFVKRLCYLNQHLEQVRLV